MAVKDEHALTTYFEKQYIAHHGSAATINRYSAQWGWRSILMSMPMSEAKALVDYYFKTPSTQGHPITWFFNNYEKLAVAKSAVEEDELSRKSIREQSEQRVREWRARLGKSTDSTD